MIKYQHYIDVQGEVLPTPRSITAAVTTPGTGLCVILLSVRTIINLANEGMICEN